MVWTHLETYEHLQGVVVRHSRREEKTGKEYKGVAK